MDISVDIILGDSLDNTLGALNVDILEGVIPMYRSVSRLLKAAQRAPSGDMGDILGRVVSANHIHDNVRVSDASLDGCRVVEVVFLSNQKL